MTLRGLTYRDRSTSRLSGEEKAKCLQGKALALEKLHSAFLNAEDELQATREELESTEHAFADCQEMLEELQAFSLDQGNQMTSLHSRIKVSFCCPFPM